MRRQYDYCYDCCLFDVVSGCGDWLNCGADVWSLCDCCDYLTTNCCDHSWLICENYYYHYWSRQAALWSGLDLCRYLNKLIRDESVATHPLC